MPPTTPAINEVTPETGKSFVFDLPELRSSIFGERTRRRNQDNIRDPFAVFHSPTATAMTDPSRDTFHPRKRSMLQTPTGMGKENIYPSGTSTDQSHFECETRKRKKEVSTSVRFSDIIGHASVKLRIDELILPLGLPSNISQSILKGIRSIPTSILLYGPPGCGKVSPTLIANA
jgi:hypothetical protein